jgi:phospholipid/cholesterol/gamma-HCH transport system substrate-binding protein
MKRNPIETILGFCVLFFTVTFLFYASGRVDTKKINGYTLVANFSKIGGLEVGSDVRISGIKVGSVLATQLKPEDFTADVYLSIDSNMHLPIDTEATIADVGIMGDKYVRLEPGKAQAVLKDKGRIMRTKSYKSLEDNVSEFIFLSTK